MEDKLTITTNEGLCIVVDDTLPYEPANYVWEDYVHLGHLEGQDEEYPLYCLGASGGVEIQRDERARWEAIGTWEVGA